MNRIFASTQQHLAAFGMAAVMTVSVLSAMVSLADGYQAETFTAQPAAQQVVVIGHAATRS